MLSNGNKPRTAGKHLGQHTRKLFQSLLQMSFKFLHGGLDELLSADSASIFISVPVMEDMFLVELFWHGTFETL